MKLFSKLLIAATIVLTGFILAFGVMFYSFFFSEKVKEFEQTTIIVFSNYHDLKAKSKILHADNVDLSVSLEEWERSAQKFEDSVNQLKHQSSVFNFSDTVKRELTSLYDICNKTSNTRREVTEALTDVIENPELSDVEKAGIAITMDELKDSSAPGYTELKRAEILITEILKKDSEKVYKLRIRLNTAINHEMIHTVRRNYKFSLLFVLLIIAVFLSLALWFSRKISRTLNQREMAIKQLNSRLEEKVLERTRQLEDANNELEYSNISLLDTNRRLEQTLDELRKTRESLINSEKFALVGQLTAGIAHEINTPLSAIRSSNSNIMELFKHGLEKIFSFDYSLDTSEEQKFRHLIKNRKHFLSDFHNEKKLKKKVLTSLRDENIESAEILAEYFLQFGFSEENLGEYITLVKLPRGMELVHNAAVIAMAAISSQIIDHSQSKIHSVLQSLKSITEIDNSSYQSEINIHELLMDVLHEYEQSVDNVTFVKKFGPVKGVLLTPGKSSVIWKKLIDNSLQAMNYKGTIQIETEYTGDGYVRVSIADDGPGIAEEIQQKLFKTFVTTKQYGQGLGAGLFLVKRLLDGENGSIAFESTAGKTVFSVFLRSADYE